VDLRIPAPFLLAGPRVDGKYDAPVRNSVNSAIPKQRSGFLVAASDPDIEGPFQPQPVRVRGIDLTEGTVARLALCASVSDPFFTVLSGVLECCVVNASCGLRARERGKE